jgi:restriction system protein
VREFIGSLSVKGAKKGVLVTTSSFSRQAREVAERSNDRKVVLIDGRELATLMVRFNVGVKATHTVEIKRLDLDFFDEGTTG